MAKITVGVVCHISESNIEDIKNYIEMLGGDVCFLKTSWGRLWIKDGDSND